MIVGGEESGKNFLTSFPFQYAKQRVIGKQKNETIEEYRYKELDITLKCFVEQTLSVCPEDCQKSFLDFKDRY